MPDNRKQWLLDRRRHITATDVAAIVGLSPWRTAHDVWLDKKGLLEMQEETIPMRTGKVMQPLVLDLYEEREGLSVRRYGDTELVVSNTIPWAAATPDGELLSGDKRPVEAKWAGHRSPAEWGEEYTDRIPEKYLIQVTWQTMVLDREIADLAALFGANVFGVYRIPRHRGLENALIDKCQRFWEENILANVPPPIGAGPGAEAWLRSVYPRNTREQMVEADDAMNLAAMILKADRAVLAEAKRSYETHENRIKEGIGDASGVIGRGWRATWKASRDSEEVDWEEVARELADNVGEATFRDIVKKCTVKRPGSRRFLPRWDSEEE